jgi:hypothetical protein
VIVDDNHILPKLPCQTKIFRVTFFFFKFYPSFISSENLIGSTYNIYPETDHFSLSLLLPACLIRHNYALSKFCGLLTSITASTLASLQHLLLKAARVVFLNNHKLDCVLSLLYAKLLNSSFFFFFKSFRWS